jgi:hypothetical protein
MAYAFLNSAPDEGGHIHAPATLLRDLMHRRLDESHKAVWPPSRREKYLPLPLQFQPSNLE